MGILGDWKGIIYLTYGWPTATAEEERAVDVIVDDFSFNIWRLISGVASWDELSERARQRIRMQTHTGAIRQYWVLVDEPHAVPRSKRLTQADRARRGAKPFDRSEQQEIMIGQTPVPQDAPLFFKRLMATRACTASCSAGSPPSSC